MPNPFTIPGAPPALLGRINARRATIPAGLMMMADPPQDQPDQPNPTGAEPKGDDFKSEHSKQAVLNDLVKEREQRQALQRQVDELAPMKQQMEAIAAAFATKGDGENGTDLADKIADMQRRLDQADAEKVHATLVADVTKDYDSLSAADVALVAKLSEREAMEALAKRLSEGVKPGIPRPDRSVGKGGSGKAEGGSVSAGRDLYRERHQKTNS